MKMNKKLYGVIFVTLIMIATGITVVGTLNQEKQNKDYEGEVGTSGWGWYDPLGSWVRSDYECFVTIYSAGLGAGLGRYSIISEVKTINPTFYGMFPDAVHVTNIYGVAERIGLNTYDSCIMDYATDANYSFVYYRLWHGTLEQTSQDTCIGNFCASIFLPDQNPFEDEPYYQTPFWEFTYIRIPCVLP